MNLEQYLMANKDKIKCTACGKCCPRICPAKVGKLCNDHPERTGETDCRGETCKLTPAELVIFFGIYCPPVRKLIIRLTGISLKRIDKPMGMSSFDNRLDRLLEKEIKS